MLKNSGFLVVRTLYYYFYLILGWDLKINKVIYTLLSNTKAFYYSWSLFQSIKFCITWLFSDSIKNIKKKVTSFTPSISLIYFTLVNILLLVFLSTNW